MQRDLPPYRADRVGSLLRSPSIKQARGKHAAGQLSAADLKTVEDTEIKAIVAGFKGTAVDDASLSNPTAVLNQNPNACF
jgi:methionine synthase II (cobalamin-independent)